MERVLADDFSGAAEVAGAGFRYGLTAAVQLDLRSTPDCELSVFDSDSRSKSRTDAVRMVQSALENGSWIFKKIDSVLRGHIIAEIEPFLESGRYRRALVVPFNPELGRTIKDGVYRLNDRPISETAFRDDPQHPVLTSDVRSLLGPGLVHVCRLSDPMPDTGIVVGEGQTGKDLRGWAARVDQATLPVGAAPFFAAWLESRGRKATPRHGIDRQGKVLVVSGTVSRVVEWADPLPMPDAVFDEGSPEALNEWVAKIVLRLDEKGFAVASIGTSRPLIGSQSARLVGHLADLAASALAQCVIDQLWLEGGATASAVIRRAGWKSLDVVGELAPGVVQLRPASGRPLVVVKPGSYPYSPRST